MIELFVEVPDFELGFEIDLVIVFRAQAVARFGAVLAHHDDGSLNGREAGEDQIQKNERIGIESAVGQEEGIQANPQEQNSAKQDDESPTTAEGRDPVGEAFAESELLIELFADVAGENFVL